MKKTTPLEKLLPLKAFGGCKSLRFLYQEKFDISFVWIVDASTKEWYKSS